MLFAVSVLFSLFVCTAAEDKINLLSLPGEEKQSDMFSPNGYEPFSKVIVPLKQGQGWLIKNPKKVPIFYTQLHGVSLKPDGIYELRLRYVGQERNRILLQGVECKDGKKVKINLLANATSFLNVNGAAEYRKEFAVSPDCQTLIPLLSLINPGKSGNMIEMLLEELSICRVGTMKKASDKVKNVNLASDYDFSKYPEGDFKKIFKGYGPKAKKWTSVKAEIVKLDGENVLHIVRTPENYIYPYLQMKPFPVDPRYHFVKLTFKAKGKGSFKPGLWWKRYALNWDYYHGTDVILTDEWQTVTLIHPCMTPNVKEATVSFTSGSIAGEFWIKDLSVTML